MWQKIKCWLGWHEFEPMGDLCDDCQRKAREEGGNLWCFLTGVPCIKDAFKCKHCGKVKR